MDQAKEWGAGAKDLVELPDTCGDIAQMPQIMKQFGIAHAVVWRGVETPHDFFDWQAPDGSTVPTIYLSEGYYFHPPHVSEATAQTQYLLHKIHAQTVPALSGPPLPPTCHQPQHLHPLTRTT